MNDFDIRYHLHPIDERFSLEELKATEDVFLAHNRVGKITLSPPNCDLSLIIVIPALNEERLIRQTLSSLTRQNFPPQCLEVIVVDNGSIDQTPSIVLDYSLHSEVPIILLSHHVKGCLNAIKKGMDTAIQRFSSISLPSHGVIASIDADNRVGPDWAQILYTTIKQKRVDMIRGKTRVDPPLDPQIESLVKAICDLGNRANAYTELARLRVKERLSGAANSVFPQWLPRITGPNIAITRPAYVAIGGLDPRDPGDQASHLANPLLRMGGTFFTCEDPDLVLDITPRFSNRIETQGQFWGVSRFGNILERATKAVEEEVEVRYPNPLRLEAGLQRILTGFISTQSAIHAEAVELANNLLAYPTDPDLLYNNSNTPFEPETVSLAEAKAMLIDITTRACGLDYRIVERFMIGREHLRAEMLSFDEECFDPPKRIDSFLQRAGAPFSIIPSHLHQIASSLKEIPKRDQAHWYDAACREMEKIYAGMCESKRSYEP